MGRPPEAGANPLVLQGPARSGVRAAWRNHEWTRGRQPKSQVLPVSCSQAPSAACSAYASCRMTRTARSSDADRKAT